MSTEPQTLSPRRTRQLVVVMVALILGLSVLATMLITRGWENEVVQEQVEEQEDQRREAMPRLTPESGP